MSTHNVEDPADFHFSAPRFYPCTTTGTVSEDVQYSQYSYVCTMEAIKEHIIKPFYLSSAGGGG